MSKSRNKWKNAQQNKITKNRHRKANNPRYQLPVTSYHSHQSKCENEKIAVTIKKYVILMRKMGFSDSMKNAKRVKKSAMV